MNTILTIFVFSTVEPTTWLSQPVIRWPLTAVYLVVLLVVAMYGLHRYSLVWLYFRHLRDVPRPAGRLGEWPDVTVQLPMFNESAVAARVIDAACRLDYPPDRIEIQVLDDSTDGSAEIARRRVEYWQTKGVNIVLLHRPLRTGFKAGALAEGMRAGKGEFIAIFDADFVPPPNFLKRTLHHFSDPAVGCVQTRWDHLNREDSLLTRSQAVFLDGHFVIEHTARNRSKRWFNFNGTAGVWRREAIEAAGGWHADTLTEDVDLSYRAQAAGWRFVFLPRVLCPAELPPEINAFKAQQHRWAKGSIQTARKLLPMLLRSEAPLRVKTEAFFHLTNPIVYLAVTLMALLFYPALYVNLQPFEGGSMAGLILTFTIFALATASAGVFYVVSQRVQKRSLWGAIAQIPMLMSIGIGIAANNARGVIEALVGHASPFERTPKYNRISGADPAPAPTGDAGLSDPPAPGRASRSTGLWNVKTMMALVELVLGLYVLECARRSLVMGPSLVSFPFLLLFAVGYLYVGVNSLRGLWHGGGRARLASMTSS